MFVTALALLSIKKPNGFFSERGTAQDWVIIARAYVSQRPGSFCKYDSLELLGWYINSRIHCLMSNEPGWGIELVQSTVTEQNQV